MLQRATSPRVVGVNIGAVQDMVDGMAKKDINIHSLMIIRHGKVAAEGWSAPLTPETPHSGYSLSKSFLSAAYGFALAEGKITRDTKFTDVFPEYKNRKDKKLDSLTIHQLMCMRAGKQTSVRKVYKRVDNWLDSFVSSKWIFSPGEAWRYVSENYLAAAHMLVRVLGMSVTDYLTPRLYEPLGIAAPFWETDKDGVESGGWGINLTTEDIAKFILCCHNKGMYNGKQVIPADWIAEASSKISDTEDIEETSDSKAGYGCGFWRCKGVNGFRAEGLYSQYAISLDDYDACIVVTAGHSDLQETLDCIWKNISKIFVKEIETVPEMSTSISLPDCSAVTVTQRSPIENSVNGVMYGFAKSRFISAVGYPVSVLPMPSVFFLTDRGGNINDVTFDFSKDGCVFSWTEGGGKFKNSIFAAMNGKPLQGKVTVDNLTLSVRSYAYWENEDTLILRIRPLNAVAERQLKFSFNGKSVKMTPSTLPSTEKNAEKVGNKLKCVLKGRYFHWWIDFLVPKMGKILNPVHKGRCK